MVSASLVIRTLAVAAAAFLNTHGAALADPPTRVGRLSYIGGTVSLHTLDQEQWSPAQLNYPVISGNSLWTEPHGRSEIQVGSAELRMDQSTEMDITQLDDSGTVISLPQGVINVHLHSLPPGGIEVQTAGGEIKMTEPGSYHIDAGRVDPNNPDIPPPVTQVMVLEGQAQVESDNSSALVMPGENAVIGTDPRSFSLKEGQATLFDDWALSREKREIARQATRYVSPEVTGYEDLDSEGQWDNTPDYGTIWYPTAVAVDWAPYRYGHWAYISPWGWTWIDNAPWGFAPFHYGRWVQVHDRWGWCPGERIERPVYAPALVAFVGGHRFNVSISLGRSAPGVGWVPLAPHEVFRPYYPASINYVRNVNITNVNKTVINNITVDNINNNVAVNHYTNAHSLSVVGANDFAHGVPVHKALVSVPREKLAMTNSSPDISHIAPIRGARIGGVAPAPVTHQFRLEENLLANHPEPVVENKIGISRSNIIKPTLPVVITPAEPEHNIIKPEVAIVKPETNRRLERIGGETETVVRGPTIHHDIHQDISRPEVAHPQAVPAAEPVPQISREEHHETLREAKHPEQHGQITPTHEGWQRKQTQNLSHEESKKDAQQPNTQPEGKRKD